VSGVPQHRWDDDEKLLADLADALRPVAPLANRVAEQAGGALAWRTVDADLQLATLSFDSATEPVGSSRDANGGNRVLVFHCSPLSVEVELHGDRLLGQLVPGSSGEVTLEAADGTQVRALADEMGFFLVAAMPSGAIRLQCETATAKLVTAWFQP